MIKSHINKDIYFFPGNSMRNTEEVQEIIIKQPCFPHVEDDYEFPLEQNMLSLTSLFVNKNLM